MQTIIGAKALEKLVQNEVIPKELKIVINIGITWYVFGLDRSYDITDYVEDVCFGSLIDRIVQSLAKLEGSDLEVLDFSLTVEKKEYTSEISTVTINQNLAKLNAQLSDLIKALPQLKNFKRLIQEKL